MIEDPWLVTPKMNPEFGTAQSYPWCPEALAIIDCCAEEEGAPAAHQLLAGPVPGGWGPAAMSFGQQQGTPHPLLPQWSLELP